MMLCLAIFATVVTILIVLSYREAPDAPLFSCKSRKVEERQNESSSEKKELGNLEQLKLCFSNSEFVFTSLGTSGVLTYINIFTTVQGQLVDPYGIHSDDFFTWLGVYVQGFGVVGGVVFSILLAAYPSKMMASAYISCIMSIVCLAYFYAADIAANKL